MPGTIDQLQAEIEKKEAQLSLRAPQGAAAQNRLKYYEKGERGSVPTAFAIWTAPWIALPRS